MSLHTGYTYSYTVKKETQTIFNINVSNAIVTKHPGKSRVMMVKDDDSYLHQTSYSKSPSLGVGLITNLRSTRMLFDCPRLMTINVSIFIVFRLLSEPSSGGWEYIIGNDDGIYDKFIAYNSNANDSISYGGGWPAGEHTCEFPSGVKRTEKHLVSCHWLMSGSHLRVNDIKSVNSDFVTNHKSNGAPFGSVFTNERFSLQAPSSSNRSISGEIYGFKIVAGFLESRDITNLSKIMMSEYNI